MGKSESSKKYREEMKSQGYKSRSLWFDEKTVEVLDKISKKSSKKISDLVSEAIIEYGNKHYNLEVEIEECLTTDELAKKIDVVEAKIKSLAKTYFYSELEKDECDEITNYLKILRKKKKRIKNEETFNALNSEIAKHFSSYDEYQSFINAFKDKIYNDA
jgi:hypothetical protein